MYCQQNPLYSPFDASQPYPHPYLQIWFLCQRYRQPDGPPLLPEPEKGPLDQDADLMLAFDVLEELAEERKRAEQVRTHNQELARYQGFPV